MAGLYDNIHAKRKRIAAGSKEKMRKPKRKRIAAGSKEKMRKPGTKGAPTAKAFKKAAKTTKRK
jgi:hypothetical protein